MKKEYQNKNLENNYRYLQSRLKEQHKNWKLDQNNSGYTIQDGRET
jgi:hypothetical protein